MGRTRRVTLREAAQELGVSKEAIRKQIQRGTLPLDVAEDGRRYVYLDAGAPGGGGGGDRGGDRRDPREELIATLREQLEAERELTERTDGLSRRLLPVYPRSRRRETSEKSLRAVSPSPLGVYYAPRRAAGANLAALVVATPVWRVVDQAHRKGG